MIRFFQDKKNLVILLLGILFVIKIPQEDKRFAFWVLGGVFLCSVFDYFLNRIFLRKKVFPNSAIISGFIVSGILDYRQPWFILVIFSLLPIISKHIIKFDHKHIFNPANLSLFIATLCKIPLTWGIESNVLLLIIFGMYFAYFYKKFPHILGFLIFFIGLFAIFGINAVGLIGWFFLFLMLIEPKTSGYGALRGFIFGGIAGIASLFLFKYLPTYDAFVSSLFIANLFKPLIEKMVAG